MSHPDKPGTASVDANYTNLPKVEKETQVSESFQEALKEFFKKDPELASNPQKIGVFQYCFKHYVNFDPNFRDLSLQEKLEQASKMASDFWGTMFKV